MSQLIYPTINLFIYDLRNGLGQSAKEIEQNRSRFKLKFPESIQNSLFRLDHDLEVEYIELLGNQRIEKFYENNYLYEGYYYPVRLGDTYGLLLDCSVNNQTSTHSANYFANIKSEINLKLNNQSASIGQTWMLTASFSDYANSHPEAAAKECYQAFMPEGNWERDLQGQGDFLSGKIFELWQHRLLIQEDDIQVAKNSIQDIQESCHVIIILYPNEALHKEAATFNFDWMRLFCYRHKILFFSGQSRYIKQILKKDFCAIESGITLIRTSSLQKPDDKKLRKVLEDASLYSINISFFEYQIRNIKLNLDNYKKRLLNLQNKAKDSDINLLSYFGEYIQKKDLKQLEKDYDNLTPGVELLAGLKNYFDFVRGINELEEQKRDRSLQNTINSLALSLTLGSIIATITPNYIKDIRLLNYSRQELCKWLPSEQTDSIKDDCNASQYAFPNLIIALSLSILTVLIVKIALFLNSGVQEFCFRHLNQKK